MVEVPDVSALAALARSRHWRCIGMDGIDGVGKSEAARGLGEQLCVPNINLDAFLDKNRGGYVAYLDYASIESALRVTTGFVIEGVCLLQVLEKLDAEIDCLVYVKRFRNGLWSDEGQCVFPDGVEAAVEKATRDADLFAEFLAHQQGETYMPSPLDQLELSAELMRYHAAYKPHLRADVILHSHAD